MPTELSAGPKAASGKKAMSLPFGALPAVLRAGFFRVFAAVFATFLTALRALLTAGFLLFFAAFLAGFLIFRAIHFSCGSLCNPLFRPAQGSPACEHAAIE